MSKYTVGIDLGGTNIVAGVVDKDYNIIARAECKTAIPRPESEVCDSMAAIVKEAVKKAKLKMDDISHIGIGVPGAVNPETKIVETSPNLFFHNWEVSKMMEERLNKPVRIESSQTMQMQQLGVNFLPVLQRVAEMLLPLPLAQALAAELSLTESCTAVATMPVLSLVIWLSLRTERNVAVAERVVGKHMPLQLHLSI